MQDTAIESYEFRLHGRGPLAEEKEDTVLFKTAYFDGTDLDDKLESFLASTHERLNAEYAEMTKAGEPGDDKADSPIRLVLVGFDMSMECKTLCTTLVQSVAFGYLSSWCDLASLTLSAVGDDVSANDFENEHPKGKGPKK